MKKVIVLLTLVSVAVPLLADGPTARLIDLRAIGTVQIGPISNGRATEVYNNTTNFTGLADGGAAPDDMTVYGDTFNMTGSGDVDEVSASVCMFNGTEVCSMVRMTILFFTADGAYTFLGGFYSDVDFSGFPCGGLSNDPGCYNGGLVGWGGIQGAGIIIPVGVDVVGAVSYSTVVGGGPNATFGPIIMNDATVGFSDCGWVDLSFDGGTTFGQYWYGGNPCANYFYRVAVAPPAGCVGDFNCDGKIDFTDIDPFVAVLSGGTCCDPSNYNCDVNGDGSVDFKDIDPFVELLTSGATCP